MNFSSVTEAWLKKQRFTFKSGTTLSGVHYQELASHVDGRGDVIELWSQPWVKTHPVFSPQHVYQSATDFNVVKCWHLHARHTDQFAVTRGKIQISLVDLRSDSSTYLQVNKVILGIQKPGLLVIPPGIMHGWKALSFPEVIVINFQTEPYDPQDEHRFSWDCVLKDIWEPING